MLTYQNRNRVYSLRRELTKVNRLITALRGDIKSGKFDAFSVYWKKKDIKSLLFDRDEIRREIARELI